MYDYALDTMYNTRNFFYTLLNSMTFSTLTPSPSQSCLTTFRLTGSPLSSFFNAAEVMIPLRVRST